jgi:hypothetical protein
MPLSRDQSKILAQATSDWRPQPEKPLWARRVIDGLRKLGLVETRFTQADPGRLAVAEWRRKPGAGV